MAPTVPGRLRRSFRRKGSVSGGFAISGVSGTFTHGATRTISGSSFGAKSLTNQIFDDCQGSDVFALWDRRAPDNGSASVMDYRAVFDGVTLPTVNGSQYLCGRHLDPDNAYNQVWVETGWITPSYPYWETIHYYWRVHPSWAFTNNSPADNNFKFHTPGYEPLSEDFWYMEFEVGTFDGIPAPDLVIDCSDSGNMGYRCDSVTGGVGQCHSGGGSQTVGYSETGIDSPAEGWLHYKVQIRWDRNSTGWVRVWNYGLNILNTNGSTDTDTSQTLRRETIGSYSRSRGTDNWRFFKDIYSDRGQDALALVELSSSATYGGADMEPQPITSWADGSIGITVNQGAVTAGTRYLYVTDRSGNVTAGFPVTVA